MTHAQLHEQYLISMMEGEAQARGDHRPREPLYCASSTDRMHIELKGQMTVSYADLTPAAIELAAEMACKGSR